MTFGICDQLQEVVGPAPTGSGPIACSPATRSKSQAAQQAQLLSHPGSKEGMGPWNLPDDLRKMDDGVSMLCGFMFIQDELFVFTDERFAATFMTREEVEGKVESFAVLPILLLAEIFHPDDLPDVYAAIGAHWFRRRPSSGVGVGGSNGSISSMNSSSGSTSSRDSASPGPVSREVPEAAWICKCIDKRNTEITALVRFRSFAAPTEGYAGAAMLSILPLTRSKYIADPDVQTNMRSGVSSRHHLRDTFGALPTALPEHDDEDDDDEHHHLVLERRGERVGASGHGQDLLNEEEDDEIFLDAHGDDAMFRPLRRGMTVLSAETSGPQPVPLSKHASDPLPHHNEHHFHSQPQHTSSHLSSLSSMASHQTGVSWGGGRISECLGNQNRSASQFYNTVQHQERPKREQEEPHQQHREEQQQHRLPGNNSLDGSSSHGGAMDQDLPTVQLTQAQLFLLQGGTGSGIGLFKDIQQEQQHMCNQISPDGVTAAEESAERVATELYGSSPSPEPHLLGHSRHSPTQRAQQQQQQQKRQQERQQEDQQQEQGHQQQQQQQQQQGMVLPLPHLPGMVPSLVRTVSSSAMLGARPTTISQGKDEGGRGGALSHSNSSTDLDMSCHGPADPNGYGGLHWTPAPLASFLGVSSWGSRRGSRKEERSKD